MRQEEAARNLAQLNESNIHYKKSQSSSFNTVARSNYWSTQNQKKSSAFDGPECTRYKPKYDFVRPKVGIANFESMSKAPNIIEQIILNCYKRF